MSEKLDINLLRDIFAEDKVTSYSTSEEPDVNVRIVNIAELIEDFLNKLDYSDANIMSICVQLLTQGKVQVDAKFYNKRLTLQDPSQRLPRSHAANLVDEYVQSLVKDEDSDKEEEYRVTRKFTIQPPRRQPKEEE